VGFVGKYFEILLCAITSVNDADPIFVFGSSEVLPTLTEGMI
jgi:hypothetical protein